MNDADRVFVRLYTQSLCNIPVFDSSRWHPFPPPCSTCNQSLFCNAVAVTVNDSTTLSRRSCNVEFRHFLTMKRWNVDCFDKSQRSLLNRFAVVEEQLNFEQVSQRDDCLFSKWSSLINYSNNSNPHLNILAIVLLYQQLSIDKLLVSGIVKIHEYTICTYFYLPDLG